MNPTTLTSDRYGKAFEMRRNYSGHDSQPAKNPLRGAGSAKSLKKTRKDYDEQLKSVLKNSGLQTVRSLPRLPFASPKVHNLDMKKVEGLKDKDWESKQKFHSVREQKKKVTFLMASPKSDPKQIDYSRLLNQDILEFEKRLEYYKNSLKHQGD
jgi:hypothetical protein